MASKQTDDSSVLHSCHICWAKVTSSAAEHEASSRHQAASQLAATALARLRAHLAPSGARNPASTEDQQSGDATHTTDTPHTLRVVQFCGSCAATFPSAERASHLRSKVHLKAALEEQILDELVREYIDEEDIVFLEPSKDKQEYGLSITSNDVIKKYTCHTCAIKIPEIYRDAHEQSSRHRSCVALANAAARRTGAYLVRPTTDLPLKENDENIIALLNAYIGIKPISDERQKRKKEAEVKTVKKRLTSKEYFTNIVPFLQYVGTFCTLIIDDTDYVTIKSATDTLRVHVVNFNGLYSGEQKSGQMKCKLCDGFRNVIYTSVGDRDKLHVMSLGHIKRVLQPIDNVHCIRKINDNFLCVLCNVFMSSFCVDDHVLNDIQHTAMLTEALERGRAFKESKKDLKIVMYSSVNNDYAQSNPTIRGYVHEGLKFGQPKQNNTSPHKNSLFGSTPQNRTVQQPQEQYSFLRPSTSGTASTFDFGSPALQSNIQPNQSGTSLFGSSSTHQTRSYQVNPTLSKAFGGPAAQSNVQTNQNSTALFGSGSTQQTGFQQANQNLSKASGSLAVQSNVQATHNSTPPLKPETKDSGSTLQTGFGQSNQNSFSQSSSSLDTAATQQTDSSQNRNNGFPQSSPFGSTNQQTRFGLPNQTASLPSSYLLAFGLTAALASNQNNSSSQNISALNGSNGTKD